MKQQRNTRQRQLVLDVVRGRRDHPTAEQIYQSVREQDAHVSRGTVYRNLNLLCDNREIYRVVMSNSDRFDLRTDPHSVSYTHLDVYKRQDTNVSTHP